jgi:diguanylate cyclase (GGDEF)-like protein/PAS domain S-box-containing protein
VSSAKRAARAGFFRHVLDAAAAGVLVTERLPDGSRVIAYANPALEQLAGRAAHELLGRPLELLFGRPPSADHNYEIAAHAGRALQMQRKDGAPRWVRVSVSPLHDRGDANSSQVVILQDVTDEHNDREHLEHQAHYDALTALANRHLLEAEFKHASARAQRYGTSLWLLLLDLDGFKSINDRFGHNAGDEILRHTGRRLASAVRRSDTVARLGGDEFIVLMPDVDEKSTLAAAIDRIIDCLDQPVYVRGSPVLLSCCSGMSEYPEDGEDLVALIERADELLYTQKRARSLMGLELPSSATRHIEQLQSRLSGHMRRPTDPSPDRRTSKA